MFNFIWFSWPQQPGVLPLSRTVNLGFSCVGPFWKPAFQWKIKECEYLGGNKGCEYLVGNKECENLDENKKYEKNPMNIRVRKNFRLK